MRIPFIKRESEAEKQQRIAAKEALIAAKAKAWKRFWFNVKLVIVGVFVAFVSLIGGLIYLGRNAPPRSYEVSPPIANSSTPIATPRPTPIASPRPKAHAESDAEKQYESKTGNEIVHRKNGTIYVRQSNKNAK